VRHRSIAVSPLRGERVIIARRVLDVRLPGGESKMEIRLFMPAEDDGTWWCAYEIDWPDGKKAGAIAGYDSVQAILLTLASIGAQLYTSPYHEAGQLTWTAAGEGYGFPVPKNFRDLLRGTDIDF
jgi:hypothetical protein